jgi:hypothetical protein
MVSQWPAGVRVRTGRQRARRWRVCRCVRVGNAAGSHRKDGHRGGEESLGGDGIGTEHGQPLFRLRRGGSNCVVGVEDQGAGAMHDVGRR